MLNFNFFIKIWKYNLITIYYYNVVFFKLIDLSFKNKLNILIIFNLNKIKYNWLSVYEDHKNDFSINFLENINSNLKPLNIEICENNLLYNIINLKKKSSIFKKNTNEKYIILNYIESLKNNFDKKTFKKVFLNNNYFGNNINIKNVDMSRKLKLLISSNRNILKNFYNLKFYRKFSLSKNIKKICNFNKYNFIYKLENSLFNILMKSNFFLSSNDCVWFIKNSYISVNSIIENNLNKIILVGDIININYSNNYFNFYKERLDRTINNLYKISFKLWSINKNKSLNPQIKESYPKWINNYKFFNSSIPLNLEVDYLSMTIIVLNYNFDVYNISYYNLKFINLYLNRLYNWKYII